MKGTGRRGDHGAVSMLVMPLLAVLALVALLLAFHGGVVVAQRRVQAAADLAALAGAGALQQGRDGCAAAAVLAARNGARVRACRISGTDGREVRLRLVREGPSLFGRAVDLEASARAGPAAAIPGR